jgi:Cd2+/Zn2+-exporting ATPase
MKSKNKNILTFISGGLLLAALITYLISPGSLAQDALLIVAAVVAGVPIAIKAFQALRMKAFSIDLLVTIAVMGAMIIGEYTEAAVVTFLFLFGDYLEGRTLRKTRASLKSMIDMAPREAIVMRAGKRVTIPADEVEIGDHVIVQPGGRIPVDGKVVNGHSLINEAAITGESVPVNKREGDQVFSSTISDNGYLEIIAEKVGEDTTFSKIIELVEEAQETKAKTQKFMERFAAYYTPGIIALSVLVWFITQNVHLALTFLVIACPGALVISVPVSIVAGIGNGAKNGILIKGGDKMENLAKVNAIVFDKTGTLTKGKPAVTDIKASGISEDELLRLAAEVEVTSEHHLGKTIVKKAKEGGLDLVEKPSAVEIMKGHGLQAMLASERIYIGNKSGAEKLGVPVDPATDNFLSHQQEKGYTAVLVSRNEKIIGIISIADQIRQEAPGAIQALRRQGINHTVMLTGDNKSVAEKVAKQLGIDRVFAELLPEDKVEKVSACKDSGIKLAMVGDGINDAPAIATADVGIAMGGTATDVTMQTADVILMSDRLDKLPYAIRLAKATIRNMKQNTYFALITVALLLMGVLTDNIHLASGMLIHEISVILVILNAVRLVRFPKYQFPFRPFKAWANKNKNTPLGELAYPGCNANEDPTFVPFLPTSKSSEGLASRVSL